MPDTQPLDALLTGRAVLPTVKLADHEHRQRRALLNAGRQGYVCSLEFGVHRVPKAYRNRRHIEHIVNLWRRQIRPRRCDRKDKDFIRNMTGYDLVRTIRYVELLDDEDYDRVRTIPEVVACVDAMEGELMRRLRPDWVHEMGRLSMKERDHNKMTHWRRRSRIQHQKEKEQRLAELAALTPMQRAERERERRLKHAEAIKKGKIMAVHRRAAQQEQRAEVAAKLNELTDLLEVAMQLEDQP
ncbi:hypothetical protein [Cyanobium sp. PCC 7001]|uniref:hypothetical protein n=1 Tax=Cyanobium sp. PCC 7001 TaxID=180281 RepID=UPI0012E99B18|nr:hypothetical protein [Cyanobium sp. PCC 7001]